MIDVLLTITATGERESNGKSRIEREGEKNKEEREELDGEKCRRRKKREGGRERVCM